MQTRGPSRAHPVRGHRARPGGAGLRRRATEVAAVAASVAGLVVPAEHRGGRRDQRDVQPGHTGGRGGASTTFRSVALAALAGSPLQHGADLILPLTIATAAGFGLFILMLGVALGASDRALTLARLIVMGHERATGLVLLEALPAGVVAVAAAAGVALG